MEYQQIAAACSFSLFSTDALGCPGTAGWGMGGLVFGTLLGPETTGPGVTPVFVCFWFPGCTDHARFNPSGLCVWGVWFGVVV